MPNFLESFGQQFGIAPAWILASLFIFLRYAGPASIVFFIVYKMKRNAWFSWKIQQKFPKNEQLRSELMYSVFTSLIFGGMALGVFFLRKAGYGVLYFQIAEYGWGYYFTSIAVLIFAHDTYFYWTHRLMHHPKLFKHIHLVHHQSTNPTPYTSFSFHPLESLVEFGIVPLVALVLPLHASALFLFTAWSIAFNVMGHTGYEFSPRGFTQHWLFKWFNTPTHHNMHHSKSKYNYGLYFNIWDRLMGTNHPQYDQTFEAIKDRTEQQQRLPNVLVKTGITTVLLLVSALAFGQISIQGIKNGQYGTPESRAQQADEIMSKGLGLNDQQIKKVKEINLRYSNRIEQEVVKSAMSDWSKYRKIMQIQSDKDAELQPILTQEQYDKYESKRNEMVWEAVKAYFS